MRDLPRIFTAYLEAEAVLEARRTSDPSEFKGIEARQVLNDQAYFLLCWGQLEVTIEQRCREAIRRRRDDPDWAVRRAWDLYNPDDRRLSGLGFEDRAKLVLDPREGRRGPFARTMFHYTVRNEIAHGRLQSTRIDIETFVQDCYIIQGALHRAV